VVLARELTVDVRDSGLNSREEELADREKQLMEREQQLAGRQLQELATAHSRLEELQAARAGEVQKVWDFLGQIEAALVALGFSLLRVGDRVEEVTVALPLLDSSGAKMLKLEEVISGQLEAEGHVLVKAVAEYVLTCFWSQDPQISLEPVMQGPVTEMAEAARADDEDTTKLVAKLFERQRKTHWAPLLLLAIGPFCFVFALVIASIE
jgi:hypothetical protein